MVKWLIIIALIVAFLQQGIAFYSYIVIYLYLAIYILL